MHTLVTGGAGFIGAALVDRLLAEGHTVDVVDNLSTGTLWNLADARAGAGRDLTFHQLDVRSNEVADLIARRRPDVVWHLAAVGGTGIDDPVNDARTNVVGTIGVLHGVRAGGVRKLVVASSAAVYGEVRGERAGESRARRPLSPHGVGKHAADAYLAVFAQVESIVFTSLVLGTVYGPRATSGVVAEWTRCLVTERPCTVFGDASQLRDFVYVDDVVDALARAAERGGGMILNVGTGTGTTLGDLHTLMAGTAARLASELGFWPGPVRAAEGEPETVAELAEGGDRGPALGLRHAPARPGEAREVVLDPSRAAKALEWAPWTSLAEGVESVLRDAVERPGRR